MNRTLTIASLILVAIIAALLIWNTLATRSLDTQAEAIRHAQEYHPGTGTLCTTAFTEAVHIESGAKFTFSSGCMPPGWRNI